MKKIPNKQTTPKGSEGQGVIPMQSKVAYSSRQDKNSLEQGKKRNLNKDSFLRNVHVQLCALSAIINGFAND